jgi:PAS domain-containing protein
MLFELVLEAVFSLEAGTQKVVDANPAAARILGQGVRFMIGRTFPDNSTHILLRIVSLDDNESFSDEATRNRMTAVLERLPDSFVLTEPIGRDARTQPPEPLCQAAPLRHRRGGVGRRRRREFMALKRRPANSPHGVEIFNLTGVAS